MPVNERGNGRFAHQEIRTRKTDGPRNARRPPMPPPIPSCPLNLPPLQPTCICQCARPGCHLHLTLTLVHPLRKNDKTGSAAELSVPHATGRKLPSFHQRGSHSIRPRSRLRQRVFSFGEVRSRRRRSSSAPHVRCSERMRETRKKHGHRTGLCLDSSERRVSFFFSSE